MNFVDKSKIKAVPVEKSLALINNFIVSTSIFFNAFTESIEKKISKLSSKITDMEVVLAVLEAKLNSVPMLQDIQAPAAPAAAPAAAPTSAPSAEPVSAPAGAPAPPPAPEAPPAAPASAWGDEYKSFEKMLKVGIPMFVVQAKAVAAGLDGEVIEKIAASL